MSIGSNVVETGVPSSKVKVEVSLRAAKRAFAVPGFLRTATGPQHHKGVLAEALEDWCDEKLL